MSQTSRRTSQEVYISPSKPPILTVSQIIETLVPCGLQISEEFLNNPQPDKVQALYWVFIDILVGWRIRHIEERINALSKKLTEDSARSIELYKAMKKLLQSIGYTDFTMLDVVTPTKPRLVSVLSVLVHYMAFRHKAWNIVNKPLKQSMQKMQNAVVVCQEEAMIKERFIEAKAIRNQHASEIKEIEKDNQALLEELQQVEKKSKELNVEHQMIKSEQAPMIERLHSYKETLGLSRERLVEYKSKAEINIDHLMDSTRTFKLKTEQSREMILDYDSKLQRVETAFPRHKAILKALSTTLKLLRDVYGENAELNKAKSTNTALLEEIFNRKVQLESEEKSSEAVMKEMRKYEHNLNKVNIKFENSRERHKTRQKEFEESRKDLEEKLHGAYEELNQLMREITTHEEEVGEIYIYHLDTS
ncbi:kinetochore-associated Ndc80 complex subunit nuf2 [Rhizopus azygosporus]|uniref:Kinetochore-associated Ndc80 complex subunit nuf2 n=1 Tax=Rhizopus azygosporus TaxID=86630 RepID=A0A367IWF2_RHIAZ|nr:kinetochore-associated Ndc80 complex subunit nuf2 [Rhizopus azygosporus]